jgi:hypothetical protein
MADISFNPNHTEVLRKMLLPIPGVSAGKMFGFPAFYFRGRLFACVYGDGVGLKLPEALANDLIGTDGIVPFEPMGRKRMKGWVQINRPVSEDYPGDEAIFRQSIEFISTLPEK